MWLKLGSFSLVVASSVATVGSCPAASILQTHGRIFAARPRLIPRPWRTYVLFDNSGMTFFTGFHWKRRLRKLSVFLHLFQSRQIDGFRLVREGKSHFLHVQLFRIPPERMMWCRWTRPAMMPAPLQALSLLTRTATQMWCSPPRATSTSFAPSLVTVAQG
ncbi:hypothetical protein L7F22_068561 [Adiantum nelumboides]|nr:hypothetical protein [Adiantum nelumboides]